jgi:hypothetical protein
LGDEKEKSYFLKKRECEREGGEMGGLMVVLDEA